MKVGIIGIGAIAQLHIPALLNAEQDIVAGNPASPIGRRE